MQTQNQNALLLTLKTPTSECLKDGFRRLYAIGYKHEKRLAQCTYH